MDRNFILALVLSMGIVFGYQSLVLGPKQRAYEAAQAELLANAPAVTEGSTTPASGANTDLIAPTVVETVATREDGIAAAPGRLTIDTTELRGTINLQGLVFDDLVLKNYRETVADDSAQITLLSPQTSPIAQFIRAGIFINGQQGNKIIWEAPSGAVLTPTTPVTLTRSQDGIDHQVTISIDEHFMFTVEQTVANKTSADITVQGFGVAYQKGIPDTLKNFMILFEGPIAIVDEALVSRKYKKLLNKGPLTETGVGGWVGITDKLSLGAAIPPQDQPFQATLNVRDGPTALYASTYRLDPQTIAPGASTTITSRVFAGVKDVELLRHYQKPVAEGGLGIQRFDMAVDWGHFYILTRPMFNIIHFLNKMVGNYGVAILLLTLLIKAVLYPLANMSFKSMAGMRKVQPEMKTIREKYKDDQMKQQQQMAALYKKYKINPAAGCLPIFAQMPIFFALYKTLFVTIEMRHEGFLYIKDLAERDPTSLFNLFGLLPFDPSSIPVIGSFLAIGILPLLMGAGMWVQMKLNPPPTDPMQAKIFAFMPLVFLFIFAPFAAGLVLYWAWNTGLSVLQQYIIMKRNGADVDLIGNIKESLPFLKKPKSANDNK